MTSAAYEDYRLGYYDQSYPPSLFGPHKGSAHSGDTFPAEPTVTASDAANAAKLAGLGYVADPATAWTDGAKITVGTYDFDWDGTKWVAGSAPVPAPTLKIDDFTVKADTATTYPTELTSHSDHIQTGYTGRVQFTGTGLTPANTTWEQDLAGDGTFVKVTLTQKSAGVVEGTYGPFPLGPQQHGVAQCRLTIPAAAVGTVQGHSEVLKGTTVLNSDDYTITVTA